MTRPMTAEDLGDYRLYEDEAIREQAARLQIHMNNLLEKIEKINCMSQRTRDRIWTLSIAAQDAELLARNRLDDNPL